MSAIEFPLMGAQFLDKEGGAAYSRVGLGAKVGITRRGRSSH